MSNDFCALPTDFPLTKYGQMIFREVIRKITGDDVLDLGCGSVGHYWALGYMGRVKSITCVDYSAANIDLLTSTLATLTPEFLQFYYDDTIQFLQAEQFLSPNSTYEELAEQLITTCTRALVADFKQDLSFLGTFDTVVALEAIECGVFAGVITPYDTKNAYAQMFIDRGVSGNLNPQLADVKAALLQADFQQVQVRPMATHIYNYSQSLLIYAIKGASPL